MATYVVQRKASFTGGKIVEVTNKFGVSILTNLKLRNEVFNCFGMRNFLWHCCKSIPQDIKQLVCGTFDFDMLVKDLSIQTDFCLWSTCPLCVFTEPPTNRQLQKPRARAWFIWKENRLLKRRTGFGMGKNLELEISGWIIISPCTNYNCSDNRSSCDNLGSYFTVNLTSLWIDIYKMVCASGANASMLSVTRPLALPVTPSLQVYFRISLVRLWNVKIGSEWTFFQAWAGPRILINL